MITGTVHGGQEAFDVAPTLTELARNRHIGLAESEQDFRDRVRTHLSHTRPGHSSDFADYVTKIAWSRHTGTTLRLDVPPAALRLIAEFANTLTDQPGTEQLRTALVRAGIRAGWFDSNHTNEAPRP